MFPRLIQFAVRVLALRISTLAPTRRPYAVTSARAVAMNALWVEEVKEQSLSARCTEPVRCPLASKLSVVARQRELLAQPVAPPDARAAKQLQRHQRGHEPIGMVESAGRLGSRAICFTVVPGIRAPPAVAATV